MKEFKNNNAAAAPSAALGLQFDPEAYSHFLADCDWTQEQKVEFTEALWKIIVAQIDLRFGTHPVQHVMGRAKALEVDSPGVLTLPDHSDINEKHGATSLMAGVAGEEDS